MTVLLLLAVSTAHEQNLTECAHGHGHHAMGHADAQARVAVGMIIVLIALSVLFEAAREAMENHAGPELLGVVHALLSELAVLGFIGFVIFITIRIGLGDVLAELLAEPEFAHVLEDLHVGLFIVMITFISFVVYLISHAKDNYDIWAHAESAINFECRGGTVRPFQRHLVQCTSTAFPALLSQLSFRVVQYDRLKARFLHFVNMHENRRRPLPQLDHRFDMAWYLHLHQREVFANIVRITRWDWLFVMATTMPLVYCALNFHAAARCEVFVFCGHLILVLATVMDWKIRQVLNALTPTMPVAEPTAVGVARSLGEVVHEERTELNPATNGKLDESDAMDNICNEELASLTAELHPLANFSEDQTKTNLEPKTADGEVVASRISALCPAAQYIGAPGSHTDLFWAPFRRCRPNAAVAASHWGEEFTRNLLCAILLSTAGYTAIFFQAARTSILAEFADGSYLLDEHEAHGHGGGHKTEHHDRIENTYTLSHCCVLVVSIVTTVALVTRGRRAAFVSLVTGLFGLWTSGAVTVTLVPSSIQLSDLSGLSLLLITLAVVPPLLIVGVLMPSAAYNFTLATAVEDLWREGLVHETLERKHKIVHVLVLLLRSARKHRRVAVSGCSTVPDTGKAGSGCSQYAPGAVHDARAIELGHSFDRFIKASQQESVRSKRSRRADRTGSQHAPVPVTSETPSLGAAQFGLLLQQHGAGSPYTAAELEAEYKLASTAATHTEGVPRTNYVAHMLAHNDDITSALASQDELNDFASQLFRMLDTDEDGRVSEAELRDQVLSVRKRPASARSLEQYMHLKLRFVFSWRGCVLTFVHDRTSIEPLDWTTVTCTR